MVNEDLSLFDPMAHEFGVQKQEVQRWYGTITTWHIRSKQAFKEGIDGILSGITGEGDVGGGMMDEPADDMMVKPT